MNRLTTAIRRLTRRQPTPPSEPHSRADNWPCPDHRDCDTVTDGPDDGAASAEVLLPPVWNEDEHDAPAADMHRPDVTPRRWRFWRRPELDTATQQWLDDMRAPDLSVEDLAWLERETAEARAWGTEWWRVRWVLAERTEEMRIVLVGVEGKLLAGAR